MSKVDKGPAQEPDQFEIIDLADSDDLINGRARPDQSLSAARPAQPNNPAEPAPPSNGHGKTRSSSRAQPSATTTLNSLGMLSRVNSDKPMFTISVAADMLSVHPRTMRIYEQQGLVVPYRTKTNRLRYSPNDLKKFHFIQFLTQYRRVNLEGVKIILFMLDELRRYGSPDPIKYVFSDYQGGDWPA